MEGQEIQATNVEQYGTDASGPAETIGDTEEAAPPVRPLAGKSSNCKSLTSFPPTESQACESTV